MSCSQRASSWSSGFSISSGQRPFRALSVLNWLSYCFSGLFGSPAQLWQCYYGYCTLSLDVLIFSWTTQELNENENDYGSFCLQTFFGKAQEKDTTLATPIGNRCQRPASKLRQICICTLTGPWWFVQQFILLLYKVPFFPSCKFFAGQKQCTVLISSPSYAHSALLPSMCFKQHFHPWWVFLCFPFLFLFLGSQYPITLIFWSWLVPSKKWERVCLQRRTTPIFLFPINLIQLVQIEHALTTLLVQESFFWLDHIPRTNCFSSCNLASNKTLEATLFIPWLFISWRNKTFNHKHLHGNICFSIFSMYTHIGIMQFNLVLKLAKRLNLASWGRWKTKNRPPHKTKHQTYVGGQASQTQFCFFVCWTGRMNNMRGNA